MLIPQSILLPPLSPSISSAPPSFFPPASTTLSKYTYSLHSLTKCPLFRTQSQYYNNSTFFSNHSIQSKMHFFKAIVGTVALASTVVAQLTLGITKAPTSVTAGETYTIEYLATDSAPVTLTLRKGASTDLKVVNVLSCKCFLSDPPNLTTILTHFKPA